MRAAIEAEGLVKRYGEINALELDRLTVAYGEILAVVGPNGAGKTTLLAILALLNAPSAGRLRVLGEDVLSRRGSAFAPWAARALRGRVTMVFEKAYLFRASVRENLDFALGARNVPVPERRARASMALEALGLAPLADRPACTLSAGERQRAALARALAIEPEILLLDEPTGSIDRESIPLVEGLLRTLARERGTTVLFSTHDFAQAARLADRVLELEQGRRLQRPGLPAAPARGG